MFKIKSLFLITLLLSTTVNYCQYTDVINSNQPGKSMGAFSVGETVFQAELGFYGYNEKHNLQYYEASGLGSDLTLRYGAFLEQLEFILDLQYQYEWYEATLEDKTSSGLSQTFFGAKYLIYDPLKKHDKTKPNLYSWKANHKFSWKQFIPAVGVYGGLNFNLASADAFTRPGYPEDPKVSPKLAVITQNQLGRYVLVINIIADKIGSDRQSLDYVVTLTRGFSPRWSGFIENDGFNSDFYADYYFRGGAAYLVKQNIQIDASIGSNLKDTPSIWGGGIGISWRFDQNYKEILLRIPGDKKDKDKDKKKSKKDKEKEKAKKRADEVEVEKTN